MSNDVAAELLDPALGAIAARIVAHCKPLASYDGSNLAQPERLVQQFLDALSLLHWLWNWRCKAALEAGTTIDATFSVTDAQLEAFTSAATHYHEALTALAVLCGERIATSAVVDRFLSTYAERRSDSARSAESPAIGGPGPAAPGVAPRATLSGAPLPKSGKNAKPPRRFLRALEDWVAAHKMGRGCAGIMRGSREYHELLFCGRCLTSMWAAIEARFKAADTDSVEEKERKRKARLALDCETTTLDEFEVAASEWPLGDADFADVRDAFDVLVVAFQTLQMQISAAFAACVMPQICKRAKSEEREEGEVDDDDDDDDDDVVTPPAKRAPSRD